MGEREKVRPINFWPRRVKVGTALRSLLLTAAIPRGCTGRAKGQQQGHLSSRPLKCSSLTASCAGRRRNEMQMDLLPNRLNVSTQGKALLGGRAAGIAELFQRGKCWKVSEAVSTLTVRVPRWDCWALVPCSLLPNPSPSTPSWLSCWCCNATGGVWGPTWRHRALLGPDLGLKCLLLAGGCSEGGWEPQIGDAGCCATWGS